MKYGKLTIIEEVESNIHGHRKYKCLCDCGNFHTAILNNLKRNITTKCKLCSNNHRSKIQTVVSVKDNKLTYSTYMSMLDRCANHTRYKKVIICDEWGYKADGSGFQKFLADMGKRPLDHTLDRIDNSKGYYKENCRWATIGLQNHNKSKRKNSSLKYIGICKDKHKKKFCVQFQYGGNKITGLFSDAYLAAIYYDNLSEQYYNDRPNKTQYQLIIPEERQIGGVSFCKKTSKFRVRLTLKNKQRISLGFYSSEFEAKFVLGNEITKYYY